MRRTAAIFLVAVLVLGGALWLLTRRSGPQDELFIHCGNSMRPALEEVAAAFTRQAGISIAFNFGGSETLLPAIKVAPHGDIFVCHDPFGPQLQEAGLMSSPHTIGHLTPILLVKKGNPKNIQHLADLAQDGLRVGLMDPRYSTCGEVTVKMLEQAHCTDAVRKNVVVEKRSHGDLANDLFLGALDAVVVWNVAAVTFEDRVQAVPLERTGPEINITACVLRCSTHPDAARQFIEYSGTEPAKKIFARHHY